MVSHWEISPSQKELLDALFDPLAHEDIKRILDVGSGRTSIQYLTDRFKDVVITGIIFPGDTRKTDPIKECVTNTSYKLIELDIKDFHENQTFDVVLAHLFLGEAEKFAGNKFDGIAVKMKSRH